MKLSYEAKNKARLQDPFIFEKNIPIPTDDGSSIMANIFRPKGEGRYPVIMSMCVYGKDLATRDLYAEEWKEMMERLPNLREHSTCFYHTWETCDPEIWVPDGYVVIRLDSRGAGKTPGYLDPFCPREIRDYYDAIEWSAHQPWSSGKIGLLGISYLAITQWLVASLGPPHLAAIIPWEGLSDKYRDDSHHGGIYNSMQPSWYTRQVLPIQHGNGASPYLDLDDGSPIAGEALKPERLAANRADVGKDYRSRELDGPFYRERSADFSKITFPLLSAANWGGMGLHGRGNFEGYCRSASKLKWLQVHGGNHRDAFYSPEGHALQKGFFDHFLKGEDNGWEKRPPVMLKVRYPGEIFKDRAENEWPLARTNWTRLYLDPGMLTLASSIPAEPSHRSYEALRDALVFTSAPFDEEAEITGPIMANLWVSSSTEDMDLFATLQLFDPAGKEVTWEGASEPAVPVAQGWLRCSHRKLDPGLSTSWRPYHTHNEIQKLEPGDVYEVQVELWPTSVVVPEDYSIRLRLEGKDFTRSKAGGILTGSGLFLHNDPEDRPLSVFGGMNTIYGGGEFASYLQIPLIPDGSR